MFLGEKIAMTAPVINRAIPGQGPACENNFTMSFFLAPSLKNPPQPGDARVFLSKLPQQTVYVRYRPSVHFTKIIASKQSELLSDISHFYGPPDYSQRAI